MVQLTSVVRVLALSVAALASLSPTQTNAHPGGHHETRSLAQIAQRRLFHENAHRSLAARANHAASRQLHAQAAKRREAKIVALCVEQQHDQHQRRQLSAADVAAVSHKSNLTGVTQDSFDLVALFGSTNKCMLELAVAEGPYYLSGALLRNDVCESEPGVDLYAELQFININTCEPVPDYDVDVWHSNSSGVYAGVVASGNGNGADLTNTNTAHGRGVFPTDDDGVVQFTTRFPDHYDGRATHIDVMGHYGGTLLPNNTYAAAPGASARSSLTRTCSSRSTRASRTRAQHQQHLHACGGHGLRPDP